jgi:hypothetical protein
VGRLVNAIHSNAKNRNDPTIFASALRQDFWSERITSPVQKGKGT